MSFPARRLRRLRRTEPMRRLLKETILAPSDLICPVFIQENLKARQKIASMPDVERIPPGDLAKEAGMIADLGIPAVMVFGIPAKKDGTGSSAFDDNGVVQKAISEIKKVHGDGLAVMADVCLCQYTSSGHCGIAKNNTIDNDSSIEILARIAVSQAAAGADIVSPSAMMDGQVSAIRAALDSEGFANVGIMSHSAKHRSSFYSPFRDAAECAPKFGDRRTYQVPYTNAREAMMEVEADIGEGVDIVMIKPALAYLDLVAEAKKRFNVPVAAYSVSGEYAMVKAAALHGWIPEEEAVREVLTSIKRAGADMMVTYFAKTAARMLRECP